MSNNPEDIKRDIEVTREELSRDVDALSEKVSPARVLERRMDKAKGAAIGVKDRVMGATHEEVSSAASTVADAATTAPAVARSQTRGNPLAAGLIAFGTGWLVSSLLPATQQEQEVAVAVKEKASKHSDAVKQPLTEAANAMKDNLREPAQQAAESVKSTAHDAAASIQDEARSAAQDVKGDAQQAKHAAGDAASSPSTDVRRQPVETHQSF
jgi:hypothetical protein